jgi:hypothetical protein
MTALTAQLQQAAAQGNQQAALSALTTYFNGALQSSMQATGGQISAGLATIASNSAGTVANLNGRYSALMASNSAVAQAFSTLNSSIAAILSNPQAPNPQQSISELVNNFQNYAQAEQGISNIPIAQYFQPAPTTSGIAGGAPSVGGTGQPIPAGATPLGSSGNYQLNGVTYDASGKPVNNGPGNGPAAQLSFQQWMQQNPSLVYQGNAYAAYQSQGGTGANTGFHF